MPTVAVHDLFIHPRDNDLIAATHGRGIWIMDDISALRQATEKVTAQDFALLDSGKAGVKWLSVTRGGYGRGNLYFKGENPPYGAMLHVYFKTKPEKPATLEISDATGLQKTVFLLDNIEPGITRLLWDFAFDPPAATIDTAASGLKTQLDTAAASPELKPEQKAEIDKALKELEAAGGNYRKITEIRQRVMPLLGRGMFTGGGRRGGFGGLAADAGIYAVKLTVGDKTVVGKVTVRLDPLQSEAR